MLGKQQRIESQPLGQQRGCLRVGVRGITEPRIIAHEPVAIHRRPEADPHANSDSGDRAGRTRSQAIATHEQAAAITQPTVLIKSNAGASPALPENTERAASATAAGPVPKPIA